MRVFVSRCANRTARWVFGLNELHTLSSFFRMTRGSALNALAAAYGRPLIRTPGFECMLEMLGLARGIGLKIAEVPMVLDHSRREGPSKMKVTRATAGYLALFARRLLTRRFRPRHHRRRHPAQPDSGDPLVRRNSRAQTPDVRSSLTTSKLGGASGSSPR
jgi:hypothetical protein